MNYDETFLQLVNLIDNKNYDEFVILLDRSLPLYPIDYQYIHGYTLLTYAIYSEINDNDLTKFIIKILKSGANVNMMHKNHRIFNPWLSEEIPPLVWACLIGRISTIDLLLEHGADLNFKISNGETIVHFPMRMNILIHLINMGIDINTVDNSGQNALFKLVGYNSGCNTAIILLDNGININQIDNEGNYAFMSCGSVECFNAIISRMDEEILSHQNNKGLDAIFIYSTKEFSSFQDKYTYKIIDILLKKNIVKNRLYYSKQLLCFVNDFDIAKLLYENGFTENIDMVINCNLNQIISIIDPFGIYWFTDLNKLSNKLSILSYIVNKTNLSMDHKSLIINHDVIYNLINLCEL
jgi:ankyrin repeat protein